MRATRNFRLGRTQSVLMPPVVGRGVIAGEACTEIGCDGPATVGYSWFERLLGLGRKSAPRTLERKDAWNSAVSGL